MIFRAWTPWASAAPPRMALVTWKASAISSSPQPFCRQEFVYAAMQYGHYTAAATASAINGFSRAVSAPSSNTEP